MTRIISKNDERASSQEPKAQAGAPLAVIPAGTVTILVSTAALVAAIVVLAASVYVWQSVSKMRGLEARLDRLDDFEHRIVGRFDQSDAAIQTLIQETNTRIVSIRSSIDQTDARRKEAIRALENMALQLRKGESTMPLSTVGYGLGAKTISLSNSLTEPEKKSLSADAGTAEFRRIESADGSVTYQTIR